MRIVKPRFRIEIIEEIAPVDPKYKYKLYLAEIYSTNIRNAMTYEPVKIPIRLMDWALMNKIRHGWTRIIISRKRVFFTDSPFRWEDENLIRDIKVEDWVIDELMGWLEILSEKGYFEFKREDPLMD